MAARRRKSGCARLAVLGISVSVAASALFAQPTPLNDRGLDGITASRADGLQPGGDVFVVVDAAVVNDSLAAVALEGEAQASATALNLVNAASADAAQGVNVADSRAGSADTDGVAVTTGQLNVIEQQGETRASIASLNLPASVVERERRESGSSSELASLVRQTENIDRQVSSRRVTTVLDVEVEPEFVGIFDTPVSIGGHEIGLPPLTLDFAPINVKFSIVDLPGDRFDVDVDIKLDVPSFTIETARLRLGEVTLVENDIIISSPALILPSLSFDFCFLDKKNCGDDGKNEETVTIGGRTLSLGDIVLEDVNPLGDLGLSFGYAIAGDGTITFDAGGFEVSGDIPLDLGTLANLDFDLKIPGVDLIKGLLGEIDLPVFTIPIDLDLDFPLPDIMREFGGEACVYEGGEEHCTPLDQRIEEFTESVSSMADSETRHQSRTETHASVNFVRSRGELNVEEGQADLIVLRDATLVKTDYRLVIVSGEAQSGVRALNMVNTATAIVGNGVNLNTERTGAQVGTGLRSTTSQINSFRQVGGL